MMSEQQFLWNSLDGGENVLIKERGSDKTIHIKIIEGKNEFVDFMKKVNEQQATIEEYEDFCLNLCKFLIGKGLVDKYREEYGKEYKIITKWKGCGSDE